MADEICIPTDRVPPKILEQLKAIGLLLQSETFPPTSSSSVLSSSLLPLLKNDDSADDTDEVDDYRPPSSLASVVSVLPSEVTTYESVSVTKNDDDIVKIFAPRPSKFKDSQTTSVRNTKHEQPHSDVVSLFATTSSSPAKQTQGKNPGQGQPSSQRQPKQSSLSPQKYSAPQTSHSSQQYLTSPFNDISAQRSSPSPYQPQHSSPAFNFPPNHEELRQLPRTPVKHSMSPPISESSYDPASTSSASSPQSSLRSRSSLTRFTDDDVVRGNPPFSATPSVESGPRSPKMLTPPETPESEGKRAVPEIFTFDDVTCARYRQLSERFQQQLQEQQFTPTKRTPSTPRKHSATPSYRRPEIPRSPSFHSPPRRLSPVDQRLLQCFEAAASAPSPQPKKKAPEVSDSPSTPMKRISTQEYPSPSSQRRDSLSPLPRTRLDFEEDSVSPHVLSQLRMSYDASGQPYSLPSPRCMAGGSEHQFTFPPYSKDGPQYGPRAGPAGPGKAALVRELRKRMDFLAAYQEERGGDGDDGNGRPLQYAPAAYAESSYETLEFHGRMSQKSKSYSTKRRRQDHNNDGNDDMPMCTCAVMERNFLQMAEGAYTRVRRMDNSPEDFERFRTELAQTNDILRQSMGLMKHIRDICDHQWKRPRW